MHGCDRHMLPPVCCQPNTHPWTPQDILVGGAVAGAVGVALFSGLRKDPVPCDLCNGTGGTRCFGCEGEGQMLSKAPRDGLYEQQQRQRDLLGRSTNSRECKVCKGAGLVLCSQCRGSGYMNKL